MSTMVCIYETLDPVDRHVVYDFLTSKGLETALRLTVASSLLMFGLCFFLLEYGLRPRCRCGAQEQKTPSPRSDEAPS